MKKDKLLTKKERRQIYDDIMDDILQYKFLDTPDSCHMFDRLSLKLKNTLKMIHVQESDYEDYF